jgi:hypothetical protein
MSLKRRFHVLEPSVVGKSGEITDMTSLPAHTVIKKAYFHGTCLWRLKETAANIGQKHNISLKVAVQRPDFMALPLYIQYRPRSQPGT